MSKRELFEMLVDEFGFNVELTQYNKNQYIIRRNTTKFSYKSEYALISLDNEILEIEVDNERVSFILSDPNLFDNLDNTFKRILFHYSYTSVGIPLTGTKVFDCEL